MYKVIGKKEKIIKNLGGKGFNLLKLDKLGLTPNFIIISSSIFDNYLRKDHLLFEHLNTNFPKKINLGFIRKRILKFQPDRNFLIKTNNTLDQLSINKFIIRSSFISEDSKNLSYAGLFSSYRCRKKGDIFLYLKKVWASQFTERVLNYQKGKKDFKYGMAVIIHDFIQPDFSGVVFLQKDKFQEILIEYCEKSYQGIESGTKAPFVYLWRDGFPYLNSPVSKLHSEWIQNLINQVLKYRKKNNASLDIEFAVLKNKVWLLQIRPLTEKVDTEGGFFIFERQKRWKHHLDDFSIQEFKKILKKLKLTFPLKIEKRQEGIFISADSYFSFIDTLKNKSTDLKFLNDFYKHFLKFILSQHTKTKRVSKELIPLIVATKELNFKMSIIDFIHNLVIRNLKEFLIKKYKITESKNLAYFVPPLSFTTYSFLLHYKSNKKFPKLCDRKSLKRLDGHDLNKLVNNIKANQRKILGAHKRLKGEQKKYFVMFKKLIWLRDVVDYYYNVIASFYGDNLSLILDRENIRRPFKDFLGIFCRFSMGEIQEIRKNKFCPDPDFLIKRRQKSTYQKNYTFPLKGIVASKGNFSGITKVIKNFSDIRKITSRNILVSQYTRPPLVVGMAICKGIITEEGGLTSHAAIVSRELGKPCVIKVDGCTIALKDGDKIKVVNGKIYKVK